MQTTLSLDDCINLVAFLRFILGIDYSIYILLEYARGSRPHFTYIPKQEKHNLGVARLEVILSTSGFIYGCDTMGSYLT